MHIYTYDFKFKNLKFWFNFYAKAATPQKKGRRLLKLRSSHQNVVGGLTSPTK